MDTLQNNMNTPEILESSLLFVDQRTLLTSAQRVCRLWRELIAASPLIQEQLFLRPAREQRIRTMNPLLAEKFPDWFPHTVDQNSSFMPFTPQRLEAYELAHKDRNAAFKYQGATWRKMLPQQPPICSFIRCTFINAMMGDFNTLSSITETTETRLSENQAYNTADNESAKIDAEPIRMGRLYHLITGGHGSSHTWLFVWNSHIDENRTLRHPVAKKFSRAIMGLGTGIRPSRTGLSELPAEIGHHRVANDLRELLEHAMGRDGLVMFECGTMQCTGGGPWRFKEKFWMSEYSYQLDSDEEDA